MNTTGHKKTDVTLGVILLLAAMLLFGMAIRYAAMYDERSLLSIVLGVLVTAPSKGMPLDRVCPRN